MMRGSRLLRTTSLPLVCVAAALVAPRVVSAAWELPGPAVPTQVRAASIRADATALPAEPGALDARVTLALVHGGSAGEELQLLAGSLTDATARSAGAVLERNATGAFVLPLEPG